jgi:hypothetical protein
MEEKKPFYKKTWFIVVVVLVVVGSIFGKKGSDKPVEKVEPAKTEVKKDSVEVPQKIELGEITRLADGYKVTCAFLKDYGYVKAKGKLKVEVFNWEMSDNVKYNDPDTYDLGVKLAEQEFDVLPEQLTNETIAWKFEGKIISDKKPGKTYLSARFTFTPESDNAVHIVGGSMYQTL